MKYVSEFRDPQAARGLLDAIVSSATREWRIMEVCGGQTHTLIRAGLDQLLAGAVSLIHGPGCPVCVTPLEKIDRALAIARERDVIFCTFGDMARVPGSTTDLLAVKAGGADVRIVYSPLDAIRLAQTHPDRRVVFFAVGFETTAPANAMAVWQAARLGLGNFSVLVSHVRVPPAVELLLGDPDCQVQGLIGPGHVCSVMGQSEYEELAHRFKVPFVIAGFEPLDLLAGIHMLVQQLEAGKATVQIQYTRAVRATGNETARNRMDEVFEIADMSWRGIGPIARSGLRVRDRYRAFDAEAVFRVDAVATRESSMCIAGEVLQGKKRPSQCPAFGQECTPETPLGAPMVSSEGACAAYHAFRRCERAPHAV